MGYIATCHNAPNFTTYPTPPFRTKIRKSKANFQIILNLIEYLNCTCKLLCKILSSLVEPKV